MARQVVVIAAAVALAAALLVAQDSVRRLSRLAASLAGVGPPFGPAAVEKEEGALRVGILGASFLARMAIVHAARRRSDARVVAVASRDEARARSFAGKHGIPHVHYGAAAYEELLARSDVDAVYVGLPTALHLRWASAALAAGKHVLLEKPATLNAEQVGELQEAARHAGRVLMEAAHWRHHPVAKRLQEILRSMPRGQSVELVTRFNMLDPKALLASLSSSHAAASERWHERVKNLDRWWYCVDSLLFAFKALEPQADAERFGVVYAAEQRFGLTASLSYLGSSGRVINATLEMARDRLLEPFEWSLEARGVGEKPWTVRLSNYGFPFLWHALDVRRSGSAGDPSSATSREQLYGEGETTFEHQLGAFAAAIRSGASGWIVAEGEPPGLGMRIVDMILSAGGSGALPRSDGAL